ncbi:hypothetical protein NG895_01285 [Aeoliella sp. ICT_H6.2]|uniref:Uncharacterized protein n=1 Tax=Aeoliella straminimaris TaxID=2954799 RepID=A0A9X2F5E7_9BACT|nr:hypothetical protein [Aeoliella straminimaris]MCO6042530.1 hypothetical protein [Aeoliella straminimaris]
MDTYGHLLPGQDLQSADRLGAMVSGRDDQPVTLRLTGTDDCVTPGATRKMLSSASTCNGVQKRTREHFLPR